MNYKILITIISIFFLASCEHNKINKKIVEESTINKNVVNQNVTNKKIVKKKIINKNIFNKYNNTGFALIYTDALKKENKITKKIDKRSLLIFHKNLKENSFVKITNPVNQKTIIAEVISNEVQFSDFYNCVITSRIAEELSLDLNEPYINLVLISQNSSFVAKKAKTFDEEKKVAEKAPVDGIKIDNLGEDIKKNKEAKKDNVFAYSIKIADFYYKDSAKSMVNRIINETDAKNPVIQTLSKTKYRVLLGPFNDIKKLEKTFNDIRPLNFEKIEILKDV